MSLGISFSGSCGKDREELAMYTGCIVIGSATVTNQQEVLGLLAVLKQQQILYQTVET
jgi:hypothetical protein